MNVRLTLSDPSVKELAKASCSNTHYNNLPKLLGEANWQQWSDALQHAALMAGTDAVLNGESRHPISLEGKQSTLAEWNENIKRTVVWRCRNESLLKAMRHSLDPGVDLSEFEGLDARRTYLGLKSIYRMTDNQQVFKLFSEKLTGELIGLADSPKETADRLREAFDQYNNLVGCNLEQRLPENFLKMAFLDALDSDVYGDSPKTLLKVHTILALDQGSALTFNELVDLVIAERARLLQEQANNTTSAPTASIQQLSKRNISQVDEPAQPDLHAPCSLPHHARHTNQKCKTQNPRLRPKSWKASVQDQEYLAAHPEIENPYSDDSSSDDSGSDESDSEVEDEVRQQTSAVDEDRLSVEKETGDNDSDVTIERDWQDLAASRCAEVKAQIDVVTRALGGGQVGIKRRSKHAPLQENLSGNWLLYDKDYNPGPAGHHHIQLWETTTEKQKQLRTKVQQYQGRLIVGPQGHEKTFNVNSFMPPARVTGRPTKITFRGPELYTGEMVFWGNGKMLVTIPAPVLHVSDSTISMFNFAGLRSDHTIASSDVNSPGNADDTESSDSSDQNSDDESSSSDSSDDEERYDCVIRGDRHLSVPIKTEDDEDTARVSDAEEAITAVAIKAEGSDSSDSDEEWADNIATTIDTVQKQQDMVSQRVIVPLHDLSGRWCFHSAKYSPGLNKDITISFYAYRDHDFPQLWCAPGHCESAPDQLRHCGELRIKTEAGMRDFHCLIQQFRVPKQTSLDPVSITLWELYNKRAITMKAWFYGRGTMRIELPTADIPNYKGQDEYITFSGLKCGWLREV
ncbi:hypothetical protein KCU71_g6781, partial [Aureobasidium melanogenum]